VPSRRGCLDRDVRLARRRGVAADNALVKRLGYVPALNGLRGLAVAAVVAHHFFVWPAGGSLGVDLFFVLSGFLITTLLLEERADLGTIRLAAFYMRRARRLLPALVVLLAAYLVIDAAKGHDGFRMVATAGLYAGNLVQAFTVPNPLDGHGLDHLWSLAEEEQFYLVWPILLLLLSRSRRLVAWLALLWLSAVVYRLGFVVSGVRIERIYMGPDTHAAGLLAGALLACVRVRWASFTVPESVAQASLFVALFAVVFFGGGSLLWLYGLPVFEVAAVGLVAAAVSPTALRTGLSWGPLVWLGSISYSLYLWHKVIIWAFDRRLPLLTLPLSLAIAWASTRWVEQPFRRRHVGARTEPAPVAA
jgi:peptidoglycan/LPS O-acetylase OafA/YrhL